MLVEIKIDKDCTEPKITITADRMTDELRALAERLSEKEERILTGWRQNELVLIDPYELIRVYSGAGRVFAVTENGEFTLKYRLYELAERLDERMFVRISNSEIINLKKAVSFDLSISGTIAVKLSNGDRSYVSRRYLGRIRQILDC